MNFRVSAALAACCLAVGGLGLSAPVLAKEDKSVSTVTTGQAGKGDKVVSTTQVAPADPVADAVKDRFRQRFSGMDVTAVRRAPWPVRSAAGHGPDLHR